MTETARGGVLVEVCPECRGIWPDRGELGKLLELVSLPDDANVSYKDKLFKRRRPKLQDFFA